MISKEKIEFIKKNERFPKDEDFYGGFGYLLIPIFIFVLAIALIQGGIEDGDYNIFFYSGIFGLILGILVVLLIWYILNINLRFYSFTTGLSRDDNIRHTKDILKNDLNIKSYEIDDSNGVVIGQTISTAFSWGEDITIICEEKYILIHSIYKSKSPRHRRFTLYKNKLNISRIKQGFVNRI